MGELGVHKLVTIENMSKRLGKKYRKREMFEEMPRKCIEDEQKQ